MEFAEYEIDKQTGFVTELPDSLPDQYQPWHQLASKTVSLMESGGMREEVLKMPQLDSKELQSFPELRLAHLQLALIASGYAWANGLEDCPESFPACVAVPLCDVSDRLGVQPGFSYFSLMENWERVDKNGPFTRENLKIRYPLKAGQAGADFNILAVYNELFFAEALPAVQDALEGLKSRSDEQAARGFRGLADWITKHHTLSKDYYEVIEPEAFFKEFAIFLQGFNETHGRPEGVVYEGVTENPKRLTNNSAASQSVMFQLIDALLRVEYDEGQLAYFQKNRTTWCQNHRDFMAAIEAWPANGREMALSGSFPELKAAYDELVAVMKKFRTYHLGFVTRFILMPAKKAREETNDQSPDPGDVLMPLLKGIRDVTGQTAV